MKIGRGTNVSWRVGGSGGSSSESRESLADFRGFHAAGSARNKADWRPMLELPPVTAAYYCCNFGHIVLGHSGKRAPWISFDFFETFLGHQELSVSFHNEHVFPQGSVSQSFL